MLTLLVSRKKKWYCFLRLLLGVVALLSSSSLTGEAAFHLLLFWCGAPFSPVAFCAALIWSVLLSHPPLVWCCDLLLSGAAFSTLMAFWSEVKVKNRKNTFKNKIDFFLKKCAGGSNLWCAMTRMELVWTQRAVTTRQDKSRFVDVQQRLINICAE